MRILITGGAGFIGSHLCDFFLAQGHKVLCMDNLLTGRVANVGHHFGNQRFSFVHYNYDVTNFIHVDGPLDYILHFASPASPADFERLAIRILKVGALGTHKALGLARAKKARFLLASTSEVYGDPLQHPQTEDYWGNVNPIGIRAVYDESKRFAEAITMAYHRTHGVEARIVRIFNTYGERMRADDELTMLELARKIIALTGSGSELVYRGLPVDDPKVRLPDISKATELLGWAPAIEPETGLQRTVEWFWGAGLSAAGVRGPHPYPQADPFSSSSRLQ